MLDPCTILPTAASELEAIRGLPNHTGANHFPRSCRRLVQNLPGNQRCCDCGAANPDWACVTYGTLVCMTCSGRHRSYGVQNSVVRSMTMDDWSHQHVLAMLEGGNHQMKGFFERHDLGSDSALSSKRYQTKAAHFYKVNLQKHVRRVSELGAYQGREYNRTQVRTHSIRHNPTIQSGGGSNTVVSVRRQPSCKNNSQRRSSSRRSLPTTAAVSTR